MKLTINKKIISQIQVQVIGTNQECIIVSISSPSYEFLQNDLYVI